MLHLLISFYWRYADIYILGIPVVVTPGNHGYHNLDNSKNEPAEDSRISC